MTWLPPYRDRSSKRRKRTGSSGRNTWPTSSRNAAPSGGLCSPPAPSKMRKPWRVNVFEVRHMSPAGAWHLRRYLDQLTPELVLIEGLADATELIPQVTRKGTK